MKANELSCKDLMVGDWVKPKNVDVSFRVGLIGVDSVWNDTDTYEWDYDELEPIPLTADILEKNWFVANKHVYPYPYYEYEVKEIKVKVGFAFPQGNRTSYKKPWVCIDTECVYIEHLPCMFVHQLQHAIRLCGIEKEIIL